MLAAHNQHISNPTFACAAWGAGYISKHSRTFFFHVLELCQFGKNDDFPYHLLKGFAFKIEHFTPGQGVLPSNIIKLPASVLR